MNEKYFDINERGCSVRCKLYTAGDARDASYAVIATYGFGGNKDNKAIAKFAERIISHNRKFLVIAFDWPCHGTDARNRLRLEDCMTYLELVCAYASQTLHVQELFNYSSSLGAYLTLKYLAEHGEPFHRIALRCPAINIYESLTRDFTEEEWTQLSRGKDVKRGHDRVIRLDREFIDEIRECDISGYDYIDYADDLLILHGTKDETVPIGVSEAFAEKNVIELIPVENADHRFSDPKSMDMAIHEIIEFLKPEG